MLTNFLQASKRFCLVLTAACLTLFFPAVSFAADSTTCTPPKSDTPGVHVPTGSSAGTYHYDCNLNLWVNDHYTFDPATGVTTPKDTVVYTYNDATGLYDYSTWQYVASDGTYSLHTSSVAQPPAGAVVVGAPKPVAPTLAPAVVSQDSPTGDGSAGNNQINNNLNASQNTTNNTNASMQNNLGSAANSGNASVTANTHGGNASTGDASALATIVNNLQTSNNAFGASGNAVTFVSNINGDVNGDLLLDPALISSVQPAAGASINNNANLTVNDLNNTNESINNNINLAAQSGDATVAKNTNAGNATTGSATAIANVLNFLNSTITSGKSFLGVININGNLNGDILLPPNFIDQLIDSNVPTVNIRTDVNNNVNVTNNTNQAINNAINTQSTSGNATVDRNTNAGDATTGTATTNITAFNLTGSNVVGSNDLLVFVNVMGKWYGMIFNAPGATAAQLGGGVTENNKVNTDVTETNNTNQAINNNINVAAASGDAKVLENTNAGDATSGDAKAAVNLLNVVNTDLSLSNWFGVLFINVLGAWTGSFGINTSAGDKLPPVPNSPASNPVFQTASNGPRPGLSPHPKVFRFVATTVGHSSDSYSALPAANSMPPSGSDSSSTPFFDKTPSNILGTHTGSSNPTPGASQANYWIPAAGVTLGVLMLLGERVRSLRQNG